MIMARILAGPFGLACLVVALAASGTTRAFAVGQSKTSMASAHAAARSQIKTSRPLSSASSGSRNSASMRMMLTMPLSRIALSSTPSASFMLPFLRQRGGAASTSISASPTKVGGLDSLTLLSTFMGYTIIAGSMLFKVPQAARIFRKKSAAGLSTSMYVLETVGIAMSLAFSIRNAFPFSTYGEAVFILLQNIIIMSGISLYSDHPRPPVLYLSLLAASLVFALTISPAVPVVVVSILQSISIPLLNFSRIPQLLLNHRTKSTGELAPSTLILQAAGNLARIFTTIVQVQNNLFLLSCVVAMLFNGALVAQLFMYRGRAPVRPPKEVW